MRGNGINYDTGFVNKGVSSRQPFDIAVVTRELQIIAHDLHCNAVRITGGDPEQLESAARIAVEAGLEVDLRASKLSDALLLIGLHIFRLGHVRLTLLWLLASAHQGRAG